MKIHNISKAYIILLTVFLHIFSTQNVFAAECKKQDTQEFIRNHNLIASAVITNENANPITSFLKIKNKFFSAKNLDSFKGIEFSEGIDLKYPTNWLGKKEKIKEGQVYLFIANVNKIGKDKYDLNECAHAFPISDQNSQELIRFARELNRNKMEFEKIIEARYKFDKQNFEKLLADFPSPESAIKAKSSYQLKMSCEGIYSPSEKTPYFLKNFDNPLPPNSYILKKRDIDQAMLGYGSTLYKLGHYEQSLRPLCLAGVSPQSTLFDTLSRIELGAYTKNKLEYIDLKRLKMSDLSINMKDIGSVDLSYSKLDNFSFNGSVLSGSNFENSKLNNLTAKNTNFDGSKFIDAQVSGNLTGSNFKNSNFQGADLNKAVLKKSNFENANLINADFSQIILEDIKSINFKGAQFNKRTIWPVGFLPNKNGLTHVSDDSDFNLTNRKEIHRGTKNNREVLRLEKKGIYNLDGFYIKDYRRISLNNNLPNVLKINYIGLLGRTFENHPNKDLRQRAEDNFKQLIVHGDSGIDTVVLDGCNEWALGNNGNHMFSIYNLPNGKTISTKAYSYQAAPSSGKQVEILIQDGLGVSFSKTCFSSSAFNNSELNPVRQESSPTYAGESNEHVLQLLKTKVREIEKTWARTSPPNLIYPIPRAKDLPNCPKGELIYTTKGFYNVQLPKGCKSILVKTWGAGGGASGGPGGFSMGIVDVPLDADVSVIVGGAGGRSHTPDRGLGGYNGGGDGGSGLPKGIAVKRGGALFGASGGGGRSELLINSKPVIIAGGGGGVSVSNRPGLPGGGRDSSDLKNAPEVYKKQRNISNEAYLLQGSNGAGGNPATGDVPTICLKAKSGGYKKGGNGADASTECQIAGAGGGGGYGGGAGGNYHSSGFAGGGAGLAPEVGITVWGRYGGGLPANTEDIYHQGLIGRAGNDGAVVIIWPAPEPDVFLKALAQHASDINPFTKSKR